MSDFAETEYKRPAKRFIKGPDRAARDEKIAAIKEKIKEVDYKLTKVNLTISLFKGGNSGDDRRKELQDELKVIIKAQGELKAKRGTVSNKLRAADASLKKKIADISATTLKNRFKTIAEIDRQIQKLDDDILSGELKIVEERRNVKEITALRKLKKDFGQIEEAQKQIDEEKANIAALKKELNSLTNKELQTRFETVLKELDEIREASKSVHSKRQTHYDQRLALQKQKDALYDEMRKINSEYRAAYDKFQKDMAAEKERLKKEEEEFHKLQEKTKKETELKKALEAASQPAFGPQILNIKLLVKYFSKMIGEPIPEVILKDDEEGAAKKLANLSINKAVGTTRVVAAPENYIVVKKEQEAYVPGGHKSKSKKGKKKTDSKFVIEPDVIVQLSELGLSVPTSKEGVPAIVEELLKQFEIFKKDQDTVTKKNIEKAKAKLEAYQKKQEAGEEEKENVEASEETQEAEK